MNKVQLLSVSDKKIKKDNARNWEKIIERYAPDLYEMSYAVGEKDAIEKIEKDRPQIVIIPDSLPNSIDVLRHIKEINNSCVVFVFVGLTENEEEIISDFMSRGAYKCYTPPLSIDTLVHDMYVALNIE